MAEQAVQPGVAETVSSEGRRLMVPLSRLVIRESGTYILDEEHVVVLARNIASQGMLGTLVVRADPLEADKFEVVAGRHRALALQWLERNLEGFSKVRQAALRRLFEAVPVLLRQIDERDFVILQFSENELRRQPTTRERARAIRRLHQLGMKDHEIGAKIGLDKSTVAGYLKALVHEEVEQAIDDEVVDLWKAEYIARSHNPLVRKHVLEVLYADKEKGRKRTRAEIQELVRNFERRLAATEQRFASRLPDPDPFASIVRRPSPVAPPAPFLTPPSVLTPVRPAPTVRPELLRQEAVVTAAVPAAASSLLPPPAAGQAVGMPTLEEGMGLVDALEAWCAVLDPDNEEHRTIWLALRARLDEITAGGDTRFRI